MPERHLRIPALALASAGMLLLASSFIPATAIAQTTPSGADCVALPETSLIKAGTLTVVTNAASYPNSYVDADGEIVGVRAEMSQMIADELCLDLEMINAPFDGHIPGLQSQRWDISNSGMVYTPARVEVVKMIPTEVQGVVIWVPGGNPRNIQTVDDLSGLRVSAEGPGYEYDTTLKLNEELVARGKAPYEVLSFGDNTKAAQAMLAGQSEALITTVPPPKDGRFEVAGEPLNQTFKSLGFNDQALADAVVEVVKRLRDDGRLAELLTRYGLTMYEGEIKVLTPDSPPGA